MTITDKELDALESLEGVYDEHGMILEGATDMLTRLLKEFRRQRGEIKRLQKQVSLRDEEVHRLIDLAEDAGLEALP